MASSGACKEKGSRLVICGHQGSAFAGVISLRHSAQKQRCNILESILLGCNDLNKLSTARSLRYGRVFDAASQERRCKNIDAMVIAPAAKKQ